jgi:hypothetical protein
MTDLSELDDLAGDLGRLGAAFHSQKLLNRLGLGAIRRVKDRTRRGLDVHGNPFQPYSDEYRQLKLDAGLKTPDPARTVTLSWGVRRLKRTSKDEPGAIEASWTDTMLDYLGHLVSPDLDAVEVFFTNPRKEKLARFHSIDGAGRSKIIREFFALSGDDLDALAGLVEGDVNELLKLNLE